MSMFFVNTGDGFDFYNTEEEAIQAAQDAIDDWRDACDPEWPEEVENVCWGKVLGTSIGHESEDGKYIEYELSESNQEWRCNLCGGIVRFDGTAPTKERKDA